MAAAGGHWMKAGSGPIAGKRLFVPKGWTEDAAYMSYWAGYTPGEMKKAAAQGNETAKSALLLTGITLSPNMKKTEMKNAEKLKAAKPKKASAPDLFTLGGAPATKAPQIANPQLNRAKSILGWLKPGETAATGGFTLYRKVNRADGWVLTKPARPGVKEFYKEFKTKSALLREFEKLLSGG